jgi:hypothetical protein
MKPLYEIGWRYLALIARQGAERLEWRGSLAVSPGRVLLCLPDDYERFLTAWRVILDLGLDRGRLILVGPRAFLQGMGRAEGEKRLAYEPKDVNAFGLAKGHLIRQVGQLHPAVAVDLNGGEKPFPVHLSLRCGAPVRAGFGGFPGARFYNFVVRPAEGTSFEENVAALFTYMGIVSDPLLRKPVNAAEGLV